MVTASPTNTTDNPIMGSITCTGSATNGVDYMGALTNFSIATATIIYAPLLAPTNFAIGYQQTKKLVFTWDSVTHADFGYYKLSENRDGGSGYPTVATTTATTYTLEVPLYKLVNPGPDNAQYMISSCKADNTCTDSAAVAITVASLTSSIGYFKASNTGNGDNFRAVSMSSDGTVIAVGAGGEDGDAKGINGEQNNNAPYSVAVYVY